MKAYVVAGTVLVSVAIATSLVLGTIGWFAVGFGFMTDCTDNYSCTTTDCAPCATTGRWINGGGVAQLVLAGIGLAVLLRGVRGKRGGYLLGRGCVVLAASLLTIVGTTWLAEESYCQLGTPGYASSYGSTDG